MFAFFSILSIVSAAAIPSASNTAPVSVEIAASDLLTNRTTNVTTAANLYCPLDIKRDFEFPHLIIPTDKDNPQHALGTAYWAEMTSKVRLTSSSCV